MSDIHDHKQGAAQPPAGLITHSADKCVGDYCCIHRPSPPTGKDSDRDIGAFTDATVAVAGHSHNTQDQQPRTKEAAHMSEGKERSVGSVGSVAVPDWDANGDPLPAGADKLLRIAELEAEVSRLRLTDAEREAIRTAADAYAFRASADGRESVNAATLRGLLKRMGGGR